MNTNKLINSLLYAFSLKGIYYRLDTKKFYSDGLGKYITKFVLYETHSKKDGVEFYSKVKLLKYLADRYKEGVNSE